EDQMDQSNGGNVSITPPSITDGSTAKVKNSNGLTSSTTNRIMNAKEKLRLPWCTEDGSAVELLKKGLAEMIGTAILVFLGCLGCVGSMGNIPSHLQICLSFGFAVIIAIQSVGHISGAHINPAITVGAVVCGHKSLLSALVYIIGQTAGGIIGYALLKMLTPSGLLWAGSPDESSSFCVTQLSERLSVPQGFFAEVLATGLLVFMWCAAVDARNSSSQDSIGIRFGLAVAALCLGFVPYTGAGMNPARSFGPALMNLQWKQHWVYWFGPFAGSIVGSLLYKSAFQPKPKDQDSLAAPRDNGV
ncbi:hypothetical protein QAD02_019808, partial [Eretmocerus hayati]